MATSPRVESAQPNRPPIERRRWFRSRRGRMLGLFLFVAGPIAAIVGWAAWRGGSGPLPDVGDPFDVAAARRPIALPDEQNAFAAYARLGEFCWPRRFNKTDFARLTWSKADPAMRTLVDQERPALKIWREGGERPDALYHQPGVALDTALPLVQFTRSRMDLAGLEGSRLEEQGALDEAWTWYRAMLRASRHVGRHGVLVERGFGAAMLKLAGRHIHHWAADPRVDARMLRKALDDVLAADALTPRLSETLKLEYLMYLRDLDELRVMVREVPLPGGKNGLLDGAASRLGMRDAAARAWLRASGDAEEARRALRLYFANLFAQADRPAAKRAPIAIRKPMMIYAPDPTAPPEANAVAPEVLAQAIGRSGLGRAIFEYDTLGGRNYQADYFLGENGSLARERKLRSTLIVRVAAELYRREHGQFPKNAGALLDGTLRSLPEGVAPDGPVPPAPP